MPRQHGDRDSLLDLEDVLVRAPVRSAFFVVGIPVEIQHCPEIEASEKVLPHTLKRRVVEPLMVRDEPTTPDVLRAISHSARRKNLT